MAAMEAADGSGGDSRCVCPAWPSDGTRAADSVRRPDVAHRLHPGRRSEGHQRRLAQQRQVRDVSHDVAAGSGQGAVSDQGRRKPESGEDAAHALRRVEEDAARAERGPAESAAAARRAARWRRQFQNRRGPIQTMALTTTAWTDGGMIPAKYTQAGAQVSPPLAWSNVPDGTHELRADRARRRCRGRPGHRRHAALDGVEHSGDGAIAGRSDSAGQSTARRLAADQRERSVLSRPRRAGHRARRITTCSRSTRSMRRSTCRRLASRRR